MIRPTWDETWMAVADIIAARSRCDNAQVGAVIVGMDERVVATGYNGPPQRFMPAGGNGCRTWCELAKSGDRGDYSKCPSIHAELNAIAYADRRHMQDGTLYVSRACCWDCTKVVANSGIRKLVMRIIPDDMHREPYRSVKFLDGCGVRVKVV